MATYATALFLFVLPSDLVPPDPSIPVKIIFLIGIGTFIFPAVFVFTLVKSRRITNLKMENANERNWPLLVTSVIYGSCYYALQRSAIPGFIILFLLGATCTMVLTLLINLRWKISLHMTGIGGLCGGLSALMLLGESMSIPILSGAFLVAGLVGTVRLYLRAHNEAQVGAGFLLGFAAEFFLLFLLR